MVRDNEIENIKKELIIEKEKNIELSLQTSNTAKAIEELKKKIYISPPAGGKKDLSALQLKLKSSESENEILKNKIKELEKQKNNNKDKQNNNISENNNNYNSSRNSNYDNSNNRSSSNNSYNYTYVTDPVVEKAKQEIYLAELELRTQTLKSQKDSITTADHQKLLRLQEDEAARATETRKRDREEEDEKKKRKDETARYREQTDRENEKEDKIRAFRAETEDIHQTRLDNEINRKLKLASAHTDNMCQLLSSSQGLQTMTVLLNNRQNVLPVQSKITDGSNKQVDQQFQQFLQFQNKFNISKETTNISCTGSSEENDYEEYKHKFNESSAHKGIGSKTSYA